MIKLSELIKTRFLLSCHSLKIDKKLTEIPDGETVDLANVKMGPDVERILRKHYGRLNMVNTTDSELNDLLQHNCKLARGIPDIPAVTFDTSVTSQDELLEYVASFKEESNRSQTFRVGPKVPTLNPDPSEITKSVSLAIIIIMKFPDINIDLGNYAADLFREVRKNWIYLKHHDKYAEVVGQAVVYRDVVNGKVHIPGIGDVSEDIYVDKYSCIPAEFGSQKLYGDEEFKGVWRSALDKVLYVKEKPASMKDHLEVR